MEPGEGHRLVEIGCLELINHIPTGKTFHTQLNPQRDVPPEAARVHGLTTEILRDKPLFSEKVESFLAFIGDSTLVIHNAAFDMKFINAELKAVGFKPLQMTRVIDTLLLAREKFPGQPANLDALCRRFKVDNSERKLHGALLDSELLSEVYMGLLGGRQQGLGFDPESDTAPAPLGMRVKRQQREKRTFPPSAAERTLHAAFLTKIPKTLWTEEEGQDA